MTGLELSRKFFEEECLPRIGREIPEVIPYLAAGLVGEGSECFGYDDEQSRDHDWGAAFCIWLPKEAGEKYGAQVLDLVKSLPASFQGFPVKPPVNGRTGVFGVKTFYRTLIDQPEAPKSAEEWMYIPEPKLAAAVNGEVFLDNYGEFTETRKILQNYYPEDIRRRYIAQNAAMAAQTGQYNFPRSLSRNDSLATQMMRSYFVRYAGNLVFLLNRRYRPFYKWTYRAMRELPILGQESYDRLNRILASGDCYETANLIEEQSAAIINEWKNQNISANPSDFMLDHMRDIISGIQDPAVRAQPISMVL